MKNNVILPGSFWIIAILLLPGCQDQVDWDQEAMRLQQNGEKLNHDYEHLNAMIDSLWDYTTECIAGAMPPEVPPVDRQIFLTSRNADHIRMFDSFQLLPDSIKALVDTAAVKDQRIADRLQVLAQQRQDFEKEKLEFLKEVAKREPTRYKMYATRLNTTNLNYPL